MKLPIYNCLIDENQDDATGIYAISFVDSPANEVDFIALRRQQAEHLNRDQQKQTLTGPILKPEQLIYRNTPTMGEYYIRFTADQIRKIAHKMMRSGAPLHNTTHQHATPLTGNYMTELWIVEDPERDKSRALGFPNLPQGTLMCSYKIEDRNYWDEQVMTGNVRGFSLEGLFNQELTLRKQQKQTNQKNGKMNTPKNKTTLLQRIAKHLLGIEDVKKKDITDSGEPYILFTLADGKETYVDQDAFATLDGEQMPAGEHKLANGNLLIIDKNGELVETREPSAGITKPADATAPETLRRRQRQHMTDPSQPSDTKPAEQSNPSENLKTKIAEMQTAIDNLTQALEDAQTQVETLRRKTPSTRPAVARQSAHDTRSMTTSERMAMALSQTIERRQ